MKPRHVSPLAQTTLCTCLTALALMATMAATAHAAGHDAIDHSAHQGHLMAGMDATASKTAETPLDLVVPDAELVDQDGRTVRLRELVGGKRAAINFIFTSCTTVCPPMGALFARMQRELEARSVDDVAFISISIDPAVDTPERLKQWATKFDGSERWRLLTGPKQAVDGVLQELGVFSALKEEHAPLILLGDARSHTWIRAHGLAPPADLIGVLDSFETVDPAESDPAEAARIAAARDYFTDTVLVDQDGRERRFYSDLVAGHTVVINPFFATCTGSCPVMHQALRRAQAALGDHIGRDVFLLSITVDPDGDTPERLRGYADAMGAGPGWSFLTGSRVDIDRVLSRLGQQVTQKEAHQAIFLVGNERTGLWQKVFGLGPPEDLVAAVEAVAGDDGSSQDTHDRSASR